MAYSCAYFTKTPTTRRTPSRTRSATSSTWSAASSASTGAAGHRHLDIGCGWGSLSLFAAEQYGVQVVGVTHRRPSRRRSSTQRIAERGLQDRVEIRLQDYRDVPDGPFDTISSIEMGEHVGERNYPVYTGRHPPRCSGPAAGR